MRKNKKDLHIHAQRNQGCSLHPDYFVLCMYVQVFELPLLYFNFYPTASWVLYLNTEFFICPVRMKKLLFLCLLQSRF